MRNGNGVKEIMSTVNRKDILTDYKKLKNLLTEFGVGFKEDIDSDKNPFISCTEGGTKIDGYFLFCADFYFDKNEKFTNMGIWE